MKTLLTTTLLLAVLSSTASAATIVGGDRDKHGCIGSAGYTWSQLQKSCIRLFESGIRLDPVKAPASGATLSAFVVFASDADMKRAEVFWPGAKASSLLKATAKNEWRSGALKLSRSMGSYLLSTAKGKPLYQGHAAQ